MFLINNQIFFDLEPYIDINSLQKIEKEIVLGIVKSKAYINQGGAAGHNLYNKEEKSLLDVTWPNNLIDSNNPNFEYYKALNFHRGDSMMFERYLGPYVQLGQILWLRIPKEHSKEVGIESKGIAEQCRETLAYPNFNSLNEWIKNLKIFDSIGRVIFFLSGPGEPGVIHKDQFVGKLDNFIFINLSFNKELFIVDSNGNKHYMKSKAAVFDNRNYHGAIGGKYYSWSLRIDGIFNQAWAESVGIWDHYKPN